jgi:hypothetical protein
LSSLAGSRRTYVSPRRGLERVAAALPLQNLPAGPLVLGGLALTIVLTAFIARGGTRLKPTTWVEVFLILAGAGLCALALVVPRGERTPARLRGAWVVAAFALLTALTAFSMSWSLAPNASWFETTRTLAYLAVLAGGLALGRLAPGRWSAVAYGVALAAIVICGWGLLTKVFPSALAPDEPFARLRPPFEYWNAVGLAAALGIPPLVWLAARRSGHAALNVLAWPGLGLLVVCLLLSYSRGALLAAGVGLAVWLAIVPLRLRTVVAVGGVLCATVPVIAWAFAQDGLTVDRAPMALRVDDGQALGAVLLLMVAALAFAGFAVGFLSAYRPPGERTRRRASRALVGALAAVPAVAILMLANAPGGIDGQLAKAWQQATDPKISAPSNSPGRLTATSSVRTRYWREAARIHGATPLLGSGAGSYGTVRLRYRADRTQVRHAHGYGVQTLSDLGWVGLGISLLVALTWLVAAARTLGITRGARGLPWDAERVGLAALAAVVIVFGVHSAVDWTWFVPGNAVPALFCAGWVASRGPLRERLGAAAPEPSRGPSRLALAAATLVMVTALAAVWSALQPVRAVNAQAAALDRVERGELPAAASIARIAHDRNPLSIDPLFELAAIEQARARPQEARKALEAAIQLEPTNPETWRRLGRLKLEVLRDPKGALRAFQAAYFLDPYSIQAINDVVVAARTVGG